MLDHHNFDVANEDKPKCSLCHKIAHSKCSLCYEQDYCSRDCQKTDWKNHKKVCKGKIQPQQK